MEKRRKLKCTLLNERANLKRLHGIGFQLHDILEKQNWETVKKDT